MTYSSDSKNTVLVAHLVSQVENNVDLLAKQGYISQEDASNILAKLPHLKAPNNALASSFPTPAPRATALSPAPIPAAPAVPQARALWAWSGKGTEDLRLTRGDIIEIIEETSNDWWTGRVGSRRGIFPASYVEKIQGPAPKIGRPVYKPFRAALHGMDEPPSNPVPGPRPSRQTNSLGLQEDKESKHSDLKKTMAHSAADSVGSSAGAALVGGLVNTIF